MILLDSSILIEFFRAKKKEETFFYALAGKRSDFCISVITHFEIYSGSNQKQDLFWKEFLDSVKILEFDINCSYSAVTIFNSLRKENKLIEISDILIASTCLANKVPIATLNKKHFERIENLKIISP